MFMMDSSTTTENVPVKESFSKEDSFPQKASNQNPPICSIKNSFHLRGSGSYPTMIRARTANRNKITKRTSDSTIITGRHHYHHGHHVAGTSSSGGMISEGTIRSAASKKRKLLNNKRTVYSKASRRKSLENLGLLVRNRCGTAKLLWPSEKKETDVFDLLPEGCIQVRQLIRLKSGGGGSADGSADQYHGGSGDCYYSNNGYDDGNKARYVEAHGQEDEDCYDEYEGNTNKVVVGKGLHACEARLKLKEPHYDTSSSPNGQMDWKNKKNISVIVRIRPKQDKEKLEKSIVFRTDENTIVFDPKEKGKDFYFQGVKQVTRNDFGRKRPNRNVSFHYDKVYGPEATNKEIFDEMLKDLTDHLIEGYNSTVFAYGATGSGRNSKLLFQLLIQLCEQALLKRNYIFSRPIIWNRVYIMVLIGKTYTMIGSNSNPGLTVLMIESLYKRIGELADDYDCEVVCSYLEVYNETIKDLLRPEKELSIREDGKRGIIISELSFYKPRGPQELLKLLRSGNRARTQHATDLNAESSRSHAVFEVKLCLKRKRNKKYRKKAGRGGSSNSRAFQESEENIKNDVENENDDNIGCGRSGSGGDDDDDDDKPHGINKVEVIQSKLVMVDLAGSERGTAASSSSHGSVLVDGARQREGASINKSLLALASCISALADGKCHVPYRNSKLTRLLKDSLNGLCTTVMIANISPSALTSEDTYNTLKYADRAKSIVGPVVKQKNVFMEDLVVEDCAKTQMAELHVKNVQLQEKLEEEILKRELILKELEELQKKNLEMKSEVGQEDRNVPQRRNSGMKEKGRKSRMEIDIAQKAGNVEAEVDAEVSCFAGRNDATLTEDQLPIEIQQYIEIARERAWIFSEYVKFASEARLAEWAISCKKLKTDMADFLGRLPVEDENYIWFSKLKNEVNINCGIIPNNNGEAFTTVNENDQHHKKFAVKLKSLTENLEMVRKNCEESSMLLGHNNQNSEVQSSHKMVAITLEEFLEYKRLTFEQEGNEKVNHFYQQFCHKINNQLIASGMTLMNALKLAKSVYLQLRQIEESAPTEKEIILSPVIQQEYKELLNLVYGPCPPLLPQAENKQVTTDYNSDISNSVNNDSLFQTLSPSPQNPTQLSNLGRKSSPVMDDLANLRKLVERPLLIQLTSLLETTEEEAERAASWLKEYETRKENEDLELKASKKHNIRSNSTFSRFVNSAETTNRKSLSTSHTIYESPQPPPVSRVRGGESSPESHLSSHCQTACIEKQCEEEATDDEETRRNDQDVGDNDHRLDTRRFIDNDDDSTAFPSSRVFQVETSLMETTNGSFSKGMWGSLPGTTTNRINDDDACSLVNPVKRMNSTSFEIIFDKKEREKSDGGTRHVKTSKSKKRMKEKCSTPFGPSVLSALSRQKISEDHFKNEDAASMDENWTTMVTSSSSGTTVTTSSATTSTENVMMKMNNKSGNLSSTEGKPGLDQQKKSIGNKKRLVDQALIKDYQQHESIELREPVAQKAAAEEMDLVQEENNNNENCQKDGEIEVGNPSSYIYQLESLPSPSYTGLLEDIEGSTSNKRGFQKSNVGCVERHASKRKVNIYSTKSNKTGQTKEFSASGTTAGRTNNKAKNTTTTVTNQNPNPYRRGGHLEQQQKGVSGALPTAATVVGSKPDIGYSWKNNHAKYAIMQQPKQFGNATSCNKNSRGSNRGKSLNPVLSVPPASGDGVITSAIPQELPMNVQGQRRNHPAQKQGPLQYKVSLSVKKSIALHPTKVTTDLTSRSSEKVDAHLQEQKSDHHYTSEKEKQKDVMLMMVGSGEEESEWEVPSRCKVINMPNTNQKSKQGGSQHSLLSSARSTMSHQKAPYHTNSKTFTISRESVPTANMPVISSLSGNNTKSCGLSIKDESIETLYRRRQWDQRENRNFPANCNSSNEENEEVGNDVNYTSEDMEDNDATSCYSDDCT